MMGRYETKKVRQLRADVDALDDIAKIHGNAEARRRIVGLRRRVERLRASETISDETAKRWHDVLDEKVAKYR